MCPLSSRVTQVSPGQPGQGRWPMNPSGYPNSDESHGLLHRSDWSIGDVELRGPGGRSWLVAGRNGENVIRVEGLTRNSDRPPGLRREGPTSLGGTDPNLLTRRSGSGNLTRLRMRSPSKRGAREDHQSSAR
jgi:hypothetical protein